MTDPRQFLRCMRDQFTCVRDEGGTLLGCIPRITEGTTGMRGHDGQVYVTRLAVVAALVCPTGSNPIQALNGFIPLDEGRHADLAGPRSGPGTDPDLALPPTATE